MSARVAHNDDQRKVGRRAAFGVWASGVMGVASACGDRNVTEIDGPDGKVLQMERDDLLVLVERLQASSTAPVTRSRSRC